MIDVSIFLRRLPALACMALWLLLNGSALFAGEADINGDGSVDGLDMAIMRAEMGRDDCSSSLCQADINDDGKVDDDDLKILHDKRTIGSDAAGDENAPAEPVRMTPVEEGAQLFLKEKPAEEASSDAAEDQEAEEDIKPATTRFMDNKDGTVTDTQTGLMWTKNGDLCGDTALFHQALDFIEAMNKGKYPNTGFNDWRLPTQSELRSLLDFTKLSQPGNGLPERHPFENLQSITYNHTDYLINTEHAWFFSLYCRLVGHNVESCFGHVWAVRGGR